MCCGVGQQLQLQSIGPLAWEPPYAAGVAIKRQKKKKKKKERKKGMGEENGHGEVLDSVAQMIITHITIDLQRQRFLPLGQKLDFFF